MRTPTLAACVILAGIGVPTAAEPPDRLLAHWAFESLERTDGRTVTVDLVSGRRDELRGHSRLHEGVRGSCLVLNEYDSELVRPAGGGPLVNGRVSRSKRGLRPARIRGTGLQS
jgi:hypothetical protein